MAYKESDLKKYRISKIAQIKISLDCDYADTLIKHLQSISEEYDIELSLIEIYCSDNGYCYAEFERPKMEEQIENEINIIKEKEKKSRNTQRNSDRKEYERLKKIVEKMAKKFEKTGV
jgi:exosome complex RNA-binding protein Rrp4